MPTITICYSTKENISTITIYYSIRNAGDGSARGVRTMARPDVDALLAAFRADLAAATTPEAVEEVRYRHVGKKSALKEALRGLKDLPPEERPAVAKAVNDAQAAIEAELGCAQRLLTMRRLMGLC